MWKIQIPKTESKVEEATLVKWYKKEGDQVEEEELIAEIETFKSLIEIHSPHQGIIFKIFVDEGKTVPVNTVIAVIIKEGERVAPEDIELYLQDKKEKNEDLGKDKSDFPNKDLKQDFSDSDAQVKAVPIARKFALDNKIDLFLVTGSGPGGVIVKKDVERFLNQKNRKAGFTIKEEVQLTNIQKISAERLTQSYQNIPQFTLFRRIEIETLLKRKQELNRQSNVHLSLIDFIILAITQTFKEFPEFNAVFEEGRFQLIQEVNINLAVASERGLVTPVLKNLENMDIYKIAQLRMEITKRAIEGRLQPDDFEDGTFTITNLGLQGIEYFTPIINPPQVAILGIGKLDKTFLPISISLDHRIIDGAKGADFLELLSEKMTFKLKGGE